MRRTGTSRFARRFGALAVAVASFTTAATAVAPPAHAGLLGGLVGGVVGVVGGTVNGLLGVVNAGWDDGVTTAPTTLDQVSSAIGADRVRARGYDGSGIGVAVIDSGVAPVQGLSGSGKVVNGPDLSFESQSPDYQYIDTFGHGTHMAGIIAGNDGSSGPFRGVAPGARIINLKVGTHDGATDVSQVVAGINWVTEHK